MKSKKIQEKTQIFHSKQTKTIIRNDDFLNEIIMQLEAKTSEIEKNQQTSKQYNEIIRKLEYSLRNRKKEIEEFHEFLNILEKNKEKSIITLRDSQFKGVKVQFFFFSCVDFI